MAVLSFAHEHSSLWSFGGERGGGGGEKGGREQTLYKDIATVLLAIG